MAGAGPDALIAQTEPEPTNHGAREYIAHHLQNAMRTGVGGDRYSGSKAGRARQSSPFRQSREAAEHFPPRPGVGRRHRPGVTGNPWRQRS